MCGGWPGKARMVARRRPYMCRESCFDDPTTLLSLWPGWGAKRGQARDGATRRPCAGSGGQAVEQQGGKESGRMKKIVGNFAPEISEESQKEGPFGSFESHIYHCAGR